MSNPFPGMNPYLENPVLWREIHSLLIVAIFDALNPQVRPKYRVAIEQRVYKTSDEDSLLVGVADVAVQKTQSESKSKAGSVAVATPMVQPLTVNLPMPETVRESYLEITDINTKEIITVIEIISPKNKRSGEGRNAYNKKRLQVFSLSSNQKPTAIKSTILPARSHSSLTPQNSVIIRHTSTNDKSMSADQYDTPWKEAIEIYFRECIEFFFPIAAAEIDWE